MNVTDYLSSLGLSVSDASTRALSTNHESSRGISNSLLFNSSFFFAIILQRCYNTYSL